MRGVQRLFFLSHLGSDRASAYPLPKAKAIAEEAVRRGGIDYTIVRAGVTFGQGDGLTTGLARLLTALPGIFLVPGDGNVLMQPLWVEDLVTCLVWALDDDRTRNQMYELGGPEYLTLNAVLEQVMEATGVRRRLVPIRPPYLRGITVLLEAMFPGLPVSVYWLDYLATNRTASLDTIPRAFNLMPARSRSTWITCAASTGASRWASCSGSAAKRKASKARWQKHPSHRKAVSRRLCLAPASLCASWRRLPRWPRSSSCSAWCGPAPSWT